MILTLFRSIFAPPRDLILLFAAGWAGLALSDRRARRTDIGEGPVDSVVAAMSIAFVIGGRLFFLASHLSAFANSPASIFSLNVALFDTWGGLAGAAIVAAVVLQRMRLSALKVLDLLAPLFAALGIGLALSHLASGAAFGKETNVAWAINLWGAQRHPTQIYELIAGIVTLGIIWFQRESGRPGHTFLLWLALAAGGRLVIEGFRGDSTVLYGGIRLAQLVAWVVLAAALLGLELLGQGQMDTTVPQPLEKSQRAAPRKDSAP